MQALVSTLRRLVLSGAALCAVGLAAPAHAVATYEATTRIDFLVGEAVNATISFTSGGLPGDLVEGDSVSFLLEAEGQGVPGAGPTTSRSFDLVSFRIDIGAAGGSVILSWDALQRVSVATQFPGETAVALSDLLFVLVNPDGITSSLIDIPLFIDAADGSSRGPDEIAFSDSLSLTAAGIYEIRGLRVPDANTEASGSALSVNAVPEPGTLALALAGLGLLGFGHRRTR